MRRAVEEAALDIRPGAPLDATGAAIRRAAARAIHGAGALAMADCASLDDMRRALTAGADLVGTTLSGYDGGPVPEGLDLDLVAAGRALTPHVIAEGRIATPADAAAAMARGALAVVVGSAITRTELVTAAFAGALPPRDG